MNTANLQTLFDAYATAQARADAESSLNTRSTGKGYRAAATRAFRKLNAALQAAQPTASDVERMDTVQALNSAWLARRDAS